MFRHEESIVFSIALAHFLLLLSSTMRKSFAAYLDAASYQEWQEKYVDYNFFKEKLHSYSKRRRALRKLLRGNSVYLTLDDLALVGGVEEGIGGAEGSGGGEYFQYQDEQDDDDDKAPVDPEEASQRLGQMERTDFVQALEHQVDEAARFYSAQLVELEAQLLAPLKSDSVEAVGDGILKVYCFVLVNWITVGQILIRYDAFVRTYNGVPLSDWYLHDKNGAVFHFEALEFLQEKFVVQDCQQQDSLYDMEAFNSQYQHFGDLLEKTLDSVEQAAGGHVVFRDKFISTLRYYFFAGTIQDGLFMEPKFLRLQGRHLKKEMKSVVTWRKTHEMPEEDASLKMDPENVLPLFLNLVSCFLYMMTNYIIEPSSAYYANALGSSDALAGIMIGTAPWFALISAVVYSMWTNTCYKHPILFAGALMICGNMMYAYAYSYKSMKMCLAGRAIAGLGAPRVINRRYVADATPFGLRTIASAAFALATALGAALGPGMAIILDLFEFEFNLPFLGTQYFNGMTGPGYFMALCWSIYTLLILFMFKEPTRSGLDELKRREAEKLSSALVSDETWDGDADDARNSTSDSLSLSTVDTESSEPAKSSNPLYCVKHMTRAVALCMSLVFMKRISLESIMGSTSVVTKNRYGWTIKNVGTLHFVNGCIIIPVSVLAGYLSQFYEDRFLATCLLAVTCAGMLLIVDFTDLVSHDNEGYNEGHWLAVGPVKYIAGSMIAFSGIEACESYVASLMSKVVPSALAEGTFNSGLLATLVGTSGRATGDLFITLMALISIRQLLNLLVIPGLALMIISMVLIRRNYGSLAV